MNVCWTLVSGISIYDITLVMQLVSYLENNSSPFQIATWNFQISRGIGNVLLLTRHGGHDKVETRIRTRACAAFRCLRSKTVCWILEVKNQKYTRSEPCLHLANKDVHSDLMKAET